MHFSLILAGMVFIFSPDISLFDLLPDFIGWILIVLGISRLADIEMRADDAKLLAKRMVLFSAVKAVLALFTFKFSSADLLLISFSYAIVEMITVIPFTGNLFTGLDYTAMRVGAPLDSDKLNASKWYLYVFFAVKNILAFIPASLSLFDSRLTGEYSANTWFIDFDAAVRVMMVFGFFLSAVLAVVMLVFFVPFWRSIVKNKELASKLTEHRRKEVLEVPARMIKKNTAFVFSLFIPAVVLFFDFYLDGVEILPTFAAFALVFAGALFAHRRMNEHCIPLIVTSALGFAASLVSYLYRFIPLARNSFVIDFNFSKKPLTLPLAGVTSILIALTFVLLYKLAGRFNDKYTKYHLEDSTVLYMIGGTALAAFDFALYSFPNLNTTFVFPSLIFGTAFCAIGAYYFVKLLKQIKFDNKD